MSEDKVVVQFADYKPHAAGEAICISCKYEFVSVTRTGVVWFECPSCGVEKATWKYRFDFVPGTEVRVCQCGNELFYLSRAGHLCALCGTYQEYDND